MAGVVILIDKPRDTRDAFWTRAARNTDNRKR